MSFGNLEKYVSHKCDCPVVQLVVKSLLHTVVTVKHFRECSQYQKCGCDTIITIGYDNSITECNTHRDDCKITKKRNKRKKARKLKYNNIRKQTEMEMKNQYAIAYWFDYKKFDEETRKNYTYNLYLMITSENKHQKTVSLLDKLHRNMRMLIFDFLVGNTKNCHNKESAYDYLMHRYLVVLTLPDSIRNGSCSTISYHYNRVHYYNELHYSERKYDIDNITYRDNQLEFVYSRTYSERFCSINNPSYYYMLQPDVSFEFDSCIMNIIVEYITDLKDCLAVQSKTDNTLYVSPDTTCRCMALENDNPSYNLHVKNKFVLQW